VTSIPKKKTVREIDPRRLTEPSMTTDDWNDYAEGWQLFNQREFWEAHEVWERVWKRREEESRIFFQGIIQLAAAYHLLIAKKRYGGTVRNFKKAEEKLMLFPSFFLRVDVSLLLSAIQEARTEIQNIGELQLERFNTDLIPTMVLGQHTVSAHRHL
jgi:uncharacterized protein